jgi:hypothetical protein
MNRTVLLGIAIFFAVVGIALLGGEQQAVAGHGCNSYCDCSSYGCDGACDGASSCHGRQGLFARLRARHGGRGCHGNGGCNGGCHGYADCCNSCHGGYAPCGGYGCGGYGCGGYDCGGYGGGIETVPYEGGVPMNGEAPVDGAEPEVDGGETPVPPAAALDRAPVAYRQASFRR